MDKLNLREIIIIAACVILIVMDITQCKRTNSTQKKLEQTVFALNDQIKIIIDKDGEIAYTQKMVEYNLRDLIKSDVFKTLPEAQQKLYKELLKTKGLISDLQSVIQAQGVVISNLTNPGVVTVNGDSVCFNKKDTLNFTDDKEFFQYKAKVFYDTDLKLDLSYNYKVKINSVVTRNRDGSIDVKNYLSDPNAKIISGSYFKSPDERTKFGKFMTKVSRYGIPTATFIGGMYLGHKL